MSRCDLDCDTTISVSCGDSLQEAYDKLATDYDMRGYTATFVLDNGTYSPLNMSKPLVGGNRLTLDGNGLHLTGNGRPAVSNSVAGVRLYLRNLKLAGWNGGAGVSAISGGLINLGVGMEYGQGNAEHILASYGGQISIDADYTVTGGCLTHWHSYSAGYITATSLTVDITSGIWFTRWAGVADASLVARDITYSGTIHGAKYLVHKNGFMEIGSCTLPGDIAGTLVPGSVIV